MKKLTPRPQENNIKLILCMFPFFKKTSRSNKVFLTCALLGCVQAGIGSLLVHFFKAHDKKLEPKILPKVTLLKPLCGAEPLLFEALQSFCEQDYPDLQVIFGIQNKTDPAIQIVERLKKHYPQLDITTIIDDHIHGMNRKVSNLINMIAVAKHDFLVISDSDIHAPSSTYLQEVVSLLQQPHVGIVTSLYSSVPPSSSIVQRLASAHINYNFMPGVLLSRYLGRQDCLGAVIAIKRTVLDKIGGLKTLLPHVADDAIIGKLVRAQGLTIALSPDIVQTTLAESSLTALYEHELRWNRTVCAVEPIGFTLSFLQLPLFWATLAILFNPTRRISWIGLITCWMFKAICCMTINKKVNIDSKSILPILPYRDYLSAFIMMNSFFGKNVRWRGQKMTINKYPQFQKPIHTDK